MSRQATDAPLTFNVARLLAEAPGAFRAYPIDGATVDLGEDLRLAEPIEGEVRLVRTNRGLLVQGDLSTSLAASCSRCLRDIVIPVGVRLDEEALPTIDLASGQALDTSIEPDLLRLTDHHELELEQTIREAIQLAEPIAPLCRPDCPGLCVVCGQELATGPHDHPDDDIDPRLEVLRSFAVDGEGKTD